MTDDRIQETGVGSQTLKHRRMKRIPVFFYLCSVFLVLCSLLPQSAGAEQPMHKRFVYYIYWSGIRAGTAVLDF